MKVLIIGAGATGSVMAKLLAQEKEVEQVLCGDVNLKRARKFIVPDPKLAFKALDASKKDDVITLAKGFTLLVNAATPAFNKTLMEAAIEAGTHYQDLASSEKGGHEEQLALDQKFKEKNLVGLITASASPGITNLLAGELGAKLKRIEYIKFRLLEDASSDVPFTPWSKEITMQEFSEKPSVWENNEHKTYNNFSGEEIYDFPAPFMNEKCYLVEQEEVGTVPRYIKTRYADIKICGSEVRSARMFYKLGFMKKKPVKIDGSAITPYDFLLKIWPDVMSVHSMKKLIESGKLRDAHFWAAIETRGVKDGRKKTLFRAVVKFPSQIEVNKLYPGGNHVSYAAGLTAAIFAVEIPKLETRGVYPPEAIDAKHRAELISKLKQQGIKIAVTEE